MSGIDELIEKKYKVSNEYFPSLIFNYLVKTKFEHFYLQIKLFYSLGSTMSVKRLYILEKKN